MRVKERIVVFNKSWRRCGLVVVEIGACRDTAVVEKKRSGTLPLGSGSEFWVGVLCLRMFTWIFRSRVLCFLPMDEAQVTLFLGRLSRGDKSA